MNVNGHEVLVLESAIALVTLLYGALHIIAAANSYFDARGEGEQSGGGWFWMNLVGATLLAAGVILLDFTIS